LLVAVTATHALASTAGLAQAAQQKWELEVHGGGVFESTPGGGDVTLPAPGSLLSGPTLVVPPPPPPARIVPSWYFGDGASQLNQAMASFGFFTTMVPLDDVLRSRFAERGAGASIGLRVSRLLSRRYSAEFSLDVANNPLVLTSGSIAGIEASRL